MFTGIVEEIATIRAVTKKGSSLSLVVNANEVLNGTKIGDSISVNGVCLTVSALENCAFCTDVMPETFWLTNLNSLKINSVVNLERAAKVGDRIGGYIISGHIDGTVTKSSQYWQDNAIIIKYTASNSIIKYLVKKGSVAIDGVSLTITEVNRYDFSVSIIPTTQYSTTLCQKKLGDKANIECDILGKYIERILQFNKKEINMQFLKENNFY
ncbi:riboflavin synthase [Clostridium sp. 'deep sea']|uniref:riboflavin synthase n=1 Tax=Clostridium sp. 'deep sea' TaxID=2779445 RepID=UPI0018964868|nr:riboflavin synthase [Clostridium sp. 'deep sea']QOR35474.1 riboflavin synthase [Clostridium sp. 'deep sea']